MNYKVLVVGSSGQLGQELLQTRESGWDAQFFSRSQLDIGDAEAVVSVLSDLQPAVVINAAAYTAVDLAESQIELARRANTDGPANLARACRQLGSRLIHVSTDFVFDGEAATPYRPDSPTAPLGEYGRSKLAGERAVQAILEDAVIVRTSWLYSVHGKNFVHTMLRLMRERGEVSVVSDQLGSPTWAKGLAAALWSAAARPNLCGAYHWCDAGVCSWYDFAVAIAEDAAALGILEKTATVIPISTSQYPTPAPRPAYSVLDQSASWRDFGIPGVHWRLQLKTMLAELVTGPAMQSELPNE